jgi:F0F1-type ATP synthase delta subunit
MNATSRRRVARFVADQLADGEPAARLAQVLAAYLVENRQTRLADLLIRDIETALLSRHKHLAADVVAARKLSSLVRQDLVNMLKAATNAATVELVENEDPALLGGIIVRTPEAELDASLRTKLTKLRSI